MKNITYKDFMEMLGVQKGCSKDDLEDAYYKLLFKNDPSRLGASATAEERRACAERYAEIAELYSKYRNEILNPKFNDEESPQERNAQHKNYTDSGDNSYSQDTPKNNEQSSRDSEQNSGMFAHVASVAADVVGTKRSDGTFDKKETAAKVGGVAAVLAGIFAAGKASASKGSGSAATGGMRKRGCFFRIGGCAVSIAVFLFLLAFASSIVSGGGSSSETEDTPNDFSYQDITFDETAWYRDGSNVYATVAITNKNPTRSLVGAEIQADFYDVDGNRCYSGSFNCGYLLPGQSGYACEIFSISTLDEIDRVDCYIEEGDSTWLISDYDGYTQPLDASESTIIAKTAQKAIYDNTNATVNIELKNPNDEV